MTPEQLARKQEKDARIFPTVEERNPQGPNNQILHCMYDMLPTVARVIQPDGVKQSLCKEHLVNWALSQKQLTKEELYANIGKTNPAIQPPSVVPGPEASCAAES